MTLVNFVELFFCVVVSFVTVMEFGIIVKLFTLQENWPIQKLKQIYPFSSEWSDCTIEKDEGVNK